MPINRLLLALCLCSFSCAAIAQDPRPDRVIGYRQDVFGLIGWNFAQLSDMVREKKSWDSGEFARRSERIAQLASMTDESFPIGSHTGAVTDAKPEIWENLVEFNALLADMVKQTQTLAQIAKGNDPAAIREQFGKTGGACKACHDKYKAD